MKGKSKKSENLKLETIEDTNTLFKTYLDVPSHEATDEEFGFTYKKYYFHYQKLKTVIDEKVKSSTKSKTEYYNFIGEEAKMSGETIRKSTQFTKSHRVIPTILDCKRLGNVLTKNPYEFLIECDSDDVIKFEQEDIQQIFKKFYDLFILYDISNCYNIVLSKKVDAKDYYNMLLDRIQMEIESYSLFTLCDETKRILMKILDETRVFVQSYSIPGVVDSWLEINPKLGYFDPIYDIEEINSELYENIKNGHYNSKFRFQITEQDIINGYVTTNS